MVTGHLQDIMRYAGLGDRLAQAMEYLQQTDFTAMTPGKYDVDGDNIFAIVNEFTTKPYDACEPETHRKYIDIQFMVSGKERFGWAPLLEQKPLMPYSDEQDLLLYQPENLNFLNLSAGMFIIFYPTDIHMPEICVNEPELVKKVVMKIQASAG
ncbi:YhcH/YjgK/YiaL family protein [Taibaiella soli]|uniref:DUF386 domain-containing protein n=1 Tax=Taibaiella soli TaxID=1649169 RepID=A0A2W2B3R8_9BACT|nr:YhcH/YjgK/YiaL family protein [Taibaiella soli]PZF74954.1 DUF386 domain-containing protein [Taibaiella soli]